MRNPILITALVTSLSLLSHAAPILPPAVATLPSTTPLQQLNPRSPPPQGDAPRGVVFVGSDPFNVVSVTRFTPATTGRGRVFLSQTPLSPLKSYFFLVVSPVISVLDLRVFTSSPAGWSGNSVMGPTVHVSWLGDGTDLMIKVNVHVEVEVALQVEFKGVGARGEVHLYEQPRNGDEVEAQDRLAWPFGLVGAPTGWVDGGSPGFESAGGSLSLSSLWPLASQEKDGNDEPLLEPDGKMKTD